MADNASISATALSVDPRSGFCKTNSTFYSKRQPILLPPNESLDLTTFISSRSHHGTTAFIDASTGQGITFSDFWRGVDSVSSSLSSMGVRKGHVILLLSPNSILFPIVCLSVMSLGAIITTTNPLNTKSEIAKQIADSKPFLAFTIPQLLPKISDSNLPVILMGDLIEFPGVKILTTLKELMKTPPSEARFKERVTQDDTATLLYSSGTTGASKGVESSHRNLIAMTQVIISRLDMDGREAHVFVCTVPMFHIYGVAVFATGLLAAGATVVVLPKFEMGDVLSAISHYGVTNFPLLPPILVAMVNNAEAIKRRYDLRSLKYVLCGGAPLSKEVAEGFVEKYPGVAILQGYGLTESAGIGASVDSIEESKRYGTPGLLAPSMEAKIVEPETGESLPVNRTGELWLRGPTIMKGDHFQLALQVFHFSG